MFLIVSSSGAVHLGKWNGRTVAIKILTSEKHVAPKLPVSVTSI